MCGYVKVLTHDTSKGRTYFKLIIYFIYLFITDKFSLYSMSFRNYI